MFKHPLVITSTFSHLHQICYCFFQICLTNEHILHYLLYPVASDFCTVETSVVECFLCMIEFVLLFC